VDVLTIQKQNIQIEYSDVENALKEMEISPESDVYEIIGNIMIKKNRERAVGTLTEKKNNLKMRLEFIEKQLRKTSKDAIELQKEILEINKEMSTKNE
jgi:prefoldin beta subunit